MKINVSLRATQILTLLHILTSARRSHFLLALVLRYNNVPATNLLTCLVSV